MKTQMLVCAMLLASFASQANVQTPDSVSTQSLITSIAKSNLSEEEKNILIDSYVQSRIQSSSPVNFTEGNFRHNNRQNHSERKTYCNWFRQHNNH